MSDSIESRAARCGEAISKRATEKMGVPCEVENIHVMSDRVVWDVVAKFKLRPVNFSPRVRLENIQYDSLCEATDVSMSVALKINGISLGDMWWWVKRGGCQWASELTLDEAERLNQDIATAPSEWNALADQCPGNIDRRGGANKKPILWFGDAAVGYLPYRETVDFVNAEVSG